MNKTTAKGFNLCVLIGKKNKAYQVCLDKEKEEFIWSILERLFDGKIQVLSNELHITIPKVK